MEPTAVIITTSPANADGFQAFCKAYPSATRLSHCAAAWEALPSEAHETDPAAWLHHLHLDVDRYIGGDVNTVPASDRGKRLLIADMESTIIEQEMLDELADFVGLREKVEAITAAAMRGELDFETAITERVALLKGLDASVLDELVNNRMTYMPGARELVATMKANGAYCALVSGGFTHFTAHVAAELGFDEHRANTLEVTDGKLTGRVVPPILGREAKLSALDEITTRLNITRDNAIAVGDGANDLKMLNAAGLGVAFRAKPQVRDAMAALSTGAVIDHCDLTGLLYLQGYSHAEFRAD